MMLVESLLDQYQHSHYSFSNTIAREDIMNLKVLRLAECVAKAERQAEFDRPFDESMRVEVLKIGLQGSEHRTSHCMGWIWRQWLSNAPNEDIGRKVEPFVLRELELRALSQSYDLLPRHDLFLLHCAIFASSDAQLLLVAERVADASGDKRVRPLDNGEIYAAAWCGMMKYWILGDDANAAQQAALIWGARREQGVFAAPKPLATTWLKRDWGAFVKAQRKDFEKLWQRARKDCWTVKAEDSTEIVVTTDRYQIRHQWCWAHCGMAMLAHRKGIEIATDPFWFPPNAIATAATTSRIKENPNTDQLHLF